MITNTIPNLTVHTMTGSTLKFHHFHVMAPQEVKLLLPDGSGDLELAAALMAAVRSQIFPLHRSCSLLSDMISSSCSTRTLVRVIAQLVMNLSAAEESVLRDQLGILEHTRR